MSSTSGPKASRLSEDVVAGTSTALVAVPDGMAQALIANVNPIYGLYSGMVNTIVGSLTTSSSHMIISLTNALALVTGSALVGLSGAARIETLFALTLAVGLIQLALGALKLGGLIRFVSDSVMTGFITAAAVLIVLSQLKNLIGVEPAGDRVAVKTLDLLARLAETDGRTLLVGLVTIGLLVFLKRSRLRKFADILTIVLSTLAVYALGWGSVAVVGDIGTITNRLPTPSLPDVSLLPGLIGSATALAILGLTQSAGISAAFPNPGGKRSDMSRDFGAQGAANIAGSLFQAMPSGGSLSATGVSVTAGARTRWAGVFAGLFLALLVVLAGSAAAAVPLSALAGLLIVAGVTVIRERRPYIVQIWRVSRLSGLAMTITFLVAIIISLQTAIYVGVALSLLLHNYTAATDVGLVELVRRPDGEFEEHPAPDTLPSGRATVLYVRGNFYFASVYAFEEALPTADETKGAAVILRLRGRGAISNTYLNWLRRYRERLDASGNKLMLTGVNTAVMEQLRKAGLDESIGPENIFAATPVLRESLNGALDAADDWLEERRHDETS